MDNIAFDELNMTYGSYEDITEVLKLVEDIADELNDLFKGDFIKATFENNVYFDYEEFISAFNQSTSRLNQSINFYRLILDNINNHHSTKIIMDFLYVLNDIGFTGEARAAKTNLYYRAIDYFKNQGRKTVAKLLNLLLVINDILGSLAVAIPAVHGLDEMKKMSESALKVNDLVPNDDTITTEIKFTDDIDVESEIDDTKNFPRKGDSFDL